MTHAFRIPADRVGTGRAGGLAAALMLALAAGCSSVKLDEGKGAPIESRDPTTAAQSSQGAGAGAGNSQQSSRPVAEVSVQPADPLNDPKSPLARRSVYFDYDSFVVKDEFRPTVEAHALYLATNKQRRVMIEGNTDERGSREYNLALGQKRAESVRRSLSLLGVPEAQMEAISYGEERPRGTGTDEASFAENRRADIVYR